MITERRGPESPGRFLARPRRKGVDMRGDGSGKRSLRKVLYAALAAAALPAGIIRAGGDVWKPVWGLSGAALTGTDSTKWSVRVAADGAGGAVVAWEDNRGRKACCRDTRDIYMQRLDGTGAKVWGPSDVQVAGTEDGEEILGLYPCAEGRFLIAWRQGYHSIRAAVVDLQGTVREDEDGEPVTACEPGGTLEFGGKTPLAPDGESPAVLLAWAQVAENGIRAVKAAVLRAGNSVPEAGDAQLVAEGTALHVAGVSACRGGGWLVLYWQEKGAGAELSARWVEPDGVPSGDPVILGRDESGRFLNAEAASGKEGEVLAMWTAVNPDSPSPERELKLVRVARAGKQSAARGVSAGKARVRMLYIPQTLVTVRMEGMADASSFPATREEIVWRRSSVLAADGEGGYLLGRVIGGRFLLRSAAVDRRGRIGLRAEAFICDAGNGECPQILRVGGRFLAWWMTRDNGGTKVLGRFIRLEGGKASAAGEEFEIAGAGGELPGAGSAAAAGKESAIFGWAGMLGGQAGVVRAQMISVGP